MTLPEEQSDTPDEEKMKEVFDETIEELVEREYLDREGEDQFKMTEKLAKRLDEITMKLEPSSSDVLFRGFILAEYGDLTPLKTELKSGVITSVLHEQLGEDGFQDLKEHLQQIGKTQKPSNPMKGYR